jgi:sulfite reductase alpha subunit-like flavoprotein|tara:strand:+ start:10620 stop:10817 length:198 start_codon:yes stop_codon:yes gene_type:complete
MSYADSLTEADEFLTYEEGRLQGMKDLKRRMYSMSTQPALQDELHLLQAIHEQQTLVDEMRGEEE